MGFTGLNIKGLLGASVITLSDNMTLAEKDRAFVLFVNATAASKTLTLNLPDGACCIVVNIGNETIFTLKNVSDDTGKSIGEGSINLVFCVEDAGLVVFPLGSGGK
jgi:hypothetical protein